MAYESDNSMNEFSTVFKSLPRSHLTQIQPLAEFVGNFLDDIKGISPRG